MCCGKIIIGKRQDAKYCSDKCHHHSWYSKNREQQGEYRKSYYQQNKTDLKIKRTNQLKERNRKIGADNFEGQESIYVVQLNPNSLPLRYKIGVSKNMSQRMALHRCCNPNALLVKVLKGTGVEEAKIISLFSENFRHIGGEVFDINDIEEATCLMEEIIDNDQSYQLKNEMGNWDSVCI
jgi:hypothetical protein